MCAHLGFFVSCFCPVSVVIWQAGFFWGEGRGCTATCDVAFAGEKVLQTVERLQYCDYAIENLRVLCRTFSISF